MDKTFCQVETSSVKYTWVSGIDTFFSVGKCNIFKNPYSTNPLAFDQVQMRGLHRPL